MADQLTGAVGRVPDDGPRMLVLFGRYDGPARLADVVAAMNPLSPRRALWFGGPVLDRWKTRTYGLCSAALELSDDGLVRCVRMRERMLRREYEITEAGRAVLDGVRASIADGAS